ncbi:MAG: hypothetical protein Q9159_005868 [Coniocarpon cinnabarinum]
MASFFSSGLDDRYGSTRSPRISDPPSFNPSYNRDAFSGATKRTSLANPAAAINDSRNFHRRFTTSYSSLAQQRRSAFEPSAADIFAAEKKKQEYEQLRQKRLERQKRLDLLNQESHREEVELARLSQELGIESSSGVGHQSEPTTPPEFRDAGFPTSLSRPNRFSAGNLISPSSLFKGPQKLDSQLTSPPTERARAYNALTGSRTASSSKHHADEEEAQDEVLDISHRSAASFNRNSMPVTRRDLGTNGDQNADFGHVNTHRFLFGDDDNKSDHQASTTPRPKSYFHQSGKDDFPVLLKRDMNGNMQYSAGANAMDVSSAEGSEPPSTQASKRSSLQYQPQSVTGYGVSGAHLKNGDSPPFNYSHASSVEAFSPSKNHQNNNSTSSHFNPSNRHSLGASTALSSPPRRPGLIGSPSSTMAEGSGTPKLQQSYSTNDIPTMRNVGNSPPQQPIPAQYANATPEQRLQSHNYSLGRIPHQSMSSVSSKRHSRELSSSSGSQPEEPANSQMQSIGSVLHSGSSAPPQVAAPPTATSASEFSSSPRSSLSGPTQVSSTPFSQQGVNAGYGTPNQMNTLNSSLGSLTLGGMSPQQFNPNAQTWNGSGSFSPSSYTNYGSHPGFAGSRYSEASSQRSSRRSFAGDDAARITSIRLEDLEGQILGLCTDQNGCRFLQKKLEERKPQHVQLIFNEVQNHMYDLMTDPFGNYLVQKLLEHATIEQHTAMINNAAPNMVKIALNQHGTRALQKMIEYITEPYHVETLKVALGDQIVPMIQDLNGNHVIQKCLNRLSSASIQFIIEAVAGHVIVVGTHRHGCCVIQRCIDHATPDQKAQLVAAVTECALPLVQDPFGNYVLQYIFDQGEEFFSQLLCHTFLGRIPELSKQKFSSNVIEKCIRIAEPELKHQMIGEIIDHHDFDRIVDDPFGNYVIQTAWDHATDEEEERMADQIRPILPRMRHKPYGRRFASRLNERDKRHGIATGPTPSQVASPALSYMQMNMTPTPSSAGMYNVHPDSGYGPGAFGITSPHFSQANMNLGNDFSSGLASQQMNSPSPSVFSPMHPYGNFNPPNQPFSPFGQGFGYPPS